MPRIYDDILAKCPFYLCNGKRNVVCEGITDDSTLSLRFTTVKSRNVQRRIFCNKDFEKCEIYRMLMEDKYDGEK